MDENEEYFQRQASHRQSRRRFRKINQKGERQTIIDTVDPYPVGKPPLPRGYHTVSNFYTLLSFWLFRRLQTPDFCWKVAIECTVCSTIEISGTLVNQGQFAFILLEWLAEEMGLKSTINPTTPRKCWNSIKVLEGISLDLESLCFCMRGYICLDLYLSPTRQTLPFVTL